MNKGIFWSGLLLFAVFASFSISSFVLLSHRRQQASPLSAHLFAAENSASVFDQLNVANSSSILYSRHPSTAHLDCARVLASDGRYVAEMGKNRINYNDENDVQLPMDCPSIRQRNHFAQQPASDEEAQFPIAFARTVYKDYLLVEMELAVSYAPQNWYCYAVDSKADEMFKAKIRSLANCFPNVVINQVEYSMDSAGHNMSSAQVECMKTLATSDRKWEYLISLQNHDIALRTNQELVQIFKWLQGANDLEIVKVPQNRINWTLDWSFEGLKLFKNESRYNEINKDGYQAKLTFAKGYTTSSLSRATVDHMVNELDLNRMLSQLDTMPYGIDEIYLQTLMTTDALNIPGGFTHACLDKGIGVPHITRFAAWYGMNCESKQFRHDVCIFGMEDLAVSFRDSNHLYGNKMMPAFDFGAISCWHEELFNRTYFDSGVHRLNKTLYEQMPQVRYNAEKKKNGFVDKEKFDCRKGAFDNFETSP